MSVSPPSSSRKGHRPGRTRAVLLECLPLAVLVLLAGAKLSYFNLPPREYVDNDWYPWYQGEAVRAVLGSLGTLLLLAALFSLLPAVRRFVALWLVDLAVTILVLLDVLHFRFYGDISSVSAASTAWQLPLIWRSIVALLRPTDLLFVADLALALVFRRRYVRAVRAHPLTRLRLRSLVAAGAFVTGCLLAIVPMRIVLADIDGVFEGKWFRFFGVRRIGLLNYHLYEVEQRLENALLARHAISDRDREWALSYVGGWRPTASARSPLFAAARGKNLVMVMVESLHAFPLGLRIEGQAVMPNLTAFARRSLYFDRFYGQTAEGMTADGEFASLQSLYPLRAGSVQGRYPTNNYRGIPRILAERGYATMSAHGFFGDLWNMRIVHPRLGFQRSFFREDYRETEKIGIGLSDGEFFRQTLPRLEREPRPFMAFLITLSNHHDWGLPKKYQTFRVGSLKGTLIGRYLQSVHYFDTVFGEFLGQLERGGLLDQSIIVVYGDHKAQFGTGEFGGQAELAKLLTRYADWPPPEKGLDARYWHVQNQLPLIIHLPGDAAAGTRSVSGGHLDIAPTVLNLLGIEDHDMVTLGRDLTRDEDALVVFRSGSFLYADTLCVTLDASVRTARCRDTRSGAALDPAQLLARFDQARERLRASDLIISGNLIPER